MSLQFGCRVAWLCKVAVRATARPPAAALQGALGRCVFGLSFNLAAPSSLCRPMVSNDRFEPWQETCNPTSESACKPRLPRRSFAIADVNYGGSTGYGRAFRKRLAGRWGIVDVDDCCNAATYLAEQVGSFKILQQYTLSDADDCCHAAKFQAEQVGGLFSPPSLPRLAGALWA